jgi:hypothetical protein
MRNKRWLIVSLVVSYLCFSTAFAMGLRSFVALPVDRGGKVVRIQYQHNTDIDVLIANVAYGISSKQTLLLGLPYRVSPGGTDRTGDLSTLYRHIIWQDDTAVGTRRMGLLGGIVIPTGSDRDARIQAGVVATFYRGRTEWDLDALWIEGLGDAADRARYDIAWQYRLSPAVYPEWGFDQEWTVDLELGGRWEEGGTMVHQATIGLQSILRQWVFEAGVVQDLNGTDDTLLILGTRFHF